MIKKTRPGGRTARKRREIFDAARTAFLERGYDNTSMDDVAVAAGVSKPTIYKHFGDKDQLFEETVLAEIAAAESNTLALIAALPTSQDLYQDLCQFARAHLADILQPRLVRMRRRLIGEAERFPNLAATWFENGAVAGIHTLADVFSKIADRGLLRLDDPLVAAEQFNWLVLIPLNRAMFVIEAIPPVDLVQAADLAVEMFLRAYEPRDPGICGTQRIV